jgi:hypothetical protein
VNEMGKPHNTHHQVQLPDQTIAALHRRGMPMLAGPKEYTDAMAAALKEPIGQVGEEG